MALSSEGFRCYGKVRISNKTHLNVVVWWAESPSSSGNSTIKVAAQTPRIDREPVIIILALTGAFGRVTYLRHRFDEGQFKKHVLLILDEFDDGDNQSPWLWPVSDKPLK